MVVARRLKPFLEDDLEELLGTNEGGCLRLVAHPYDLAGEPSRRMHQFTTPPTPCADACSAPSYSPYTYPSLEDENEGPRILLAVGPEGGWDESFELPMLADSDFQPVALGQRILRSDVAVNSLLGLAHERIEHWSRPRLDWTGKPFR